MVRNAWSSIVLGFLPLVGAGCASPPVARYVYQDGQYGVIGIPRNSPLGKTNYLDEAQMLMTRHFPEGYEIVRAEEVVEGERILDTAIKKELQSEPGLTALNQAIKVGKFARSSAIDQKDTTHITESRIIYKRKTPGHPSDLDGFALSASLTPEFYLDPNEIARHDEKEMLAGVKKDDKDHKLVASAKPPDKEKRKLDPDAKDKPQVAEAGFKDDQLQQASGNHPD